MKTARKPGPLSKADTAFWKVFQREQGLTVDGIVGTQTTGQLSIMLGDLERVSIVLRDLGSEIDFYKKRIRNLYIILGIGLAGGAGVLGSMQ